MHKIAHIARRAAIGTTLTLSFIFSQSANAGLIDRGNGMIYDDVLDITWLKNANLFASQYSAGTVNDIIAHYNANCDTTTGTGCYDNYGASTDYDIVASDFLASGKMEWQAAMAWADWLSFGGYSDWRLASIDPTDTSCSNGSGSNNYGFDCIGINNELNHLFNVSLGLEGINNSGWHYTAEDTPISNGVFENLMSYRYWSAEESAPNSTDAARTSNIFYGTQGATRKDVPLYGWAVRDGDVADQQGGVPVPEPSTVALFGFSVLCVALRRRNQR